MHSILQKIGGSILVIVFCVVALFPVRAQNMEGLPVFYTPTRALAGDQIALHAKVKNTEPQRGVVTIDFITVDGKVIGTQSGEIEKGAEKIMIIPWVMPEEGVVVSAQGVLFVGADGKKKELSLPIGSVTVAPSTTRQSFISETFQKVKIFLEKKRLLWLAQVEKNRDELKNSAPKMRDRIGNAIEIAETGSLADGVYGETEKTLANQMKYYGYSILRGALASATIFYAIVIILALAIVKFIFGRLV
jgi:hypothetical protein